MVSPRHLPRNHGLEAMDEITDLENKVKKLTRDLRTAEKEGGTKVMEAEKELRTLREQHDDMKTRHDKVR